MGQARNRGSFEDRKAQAIKAGRIKRKTWSVNSILATVNPFSAYLGAFMFGRNRKRYVKQNKKAA